MNKTLIGSFIVMLVLLIGMVTYLLFFKQWVKIAVIDNTKIVVNHKQIVQFEKNIENQTSLIEARVDTLSGELQKELELYEIDREKLTNSQKQIRENQLKNKREKIIQYKEASYKKLNDDKIKQYQSILQPVDDLIKKYAKEHGYKLVIGANNNANVLYVDEQIDITNEILKIINGN